jgi:hypothetical protein
MSSTDRVWTPIYRHCDSYIVLSARLITPLGREPKDT